MRIVSIEPASDDNADPDLHRFSSRGDFPLSVEDPWLETLVGYHLRHAQIAFFRDYLRDLADISLSQLQWAALSLVASHPGIAQMAVADTLRSDRNTTTAIVDRLVARRLITRRQSKRDRRRRELWLLPEGKALVESMRLRIEAIEARLLAGLTAEECGTLVRCLRKIHTANTRGEGEAALALAGD